MQKQSQQVENRLSSDVVVRFGHYEVDLLDGKISKHGLRVRLSGQPLEVLLLLLKRPGELVTREELRQRLWAGNVFVDFERSLNSAVKKLRRALYDNAQGARYIETTEGLPVHRRGGARLTDNALGARNRTTGGRVSSRWLFKSRDQGSGS